MITILDDEEIGTSIKLINICMKELIIERELNSIWYLGYLKLQRVIEYLVNQRFDQLRELGLL